jgi:hypothetical protein
MAAKPFGRSMRAPVGSSAGGSGTGPASSLVHWAMGASLRWQSPALWSIGRGTARAVEHRWMSRRRLGRAAVSMCWTLRWTQPRPLACG